MQQDLKKKDEEEEDEDALTPEEVKGCEDSEQSLEKCNSSASAESLDRETNQEVEVE